MSHCSWTKLIILIQIHWFLELEQVQTFEVPPLGIITVFDLATKSKILALETQAAVLDFGSGPPEIIKGYVIKSNPEDACKRISLSSLSTTDKNQTKSISPIEDERLDWILIANNLRCRSQDKIDNAYKAGFKAVIIYNTKSNETEIIGTKEKDIRVLSIPTFSVGNYDGIRLKENFNFDHKFYVKIVTPKSITSIIIVVIIWVGFGLAVFVLILGIFESIFNFFIKPKIRSFCNARKNSLVSKAVEAIPKVKWTVELNFKCESCVICMEDFALGDSLKLLSCSHGFHSKCIDEWLLKVRRFCPICKDRFKYSSFWDDFSDSEISEGNYLTDTGTESLIRNPALSIISNMTMESNLESIYEQDQSNNQHQNPNPKNLSTSASQSLDSNSLYYSCGTENDNGLHRFRSGKNRESFPSRMITTLACVHTNPLPEDDGIYLDGEVDPEDQGECASPLPIPITY